MGDFIGNSKHEVTISRLHTTEQQAQSAFDFINNDHTPVMSDTDSGITIVNDKDYTAQLTLEMESLDVKDKSVIVPPPMNICIIIVGTRGDVEPFIAIGKRLKKDGHRIRLATHAVYRSMVLDGGLEFYPLAGDPKALSAYVVKKDRTQNEVLQILQMLQDIIFSCWPAAQADDPENQLPPFHCNAIISNPVTYGQIHVAEKLEVPLHIMFPQPSIPTTAFPHPRTNLPYTGVNEKKNYISYKMANSGVWHRTENMINRFRQEVLGLEKIGENGGDILILRQIPHSFMWSRHLIPQPEDWDCSLYDVVGTVRDESVPYYVPSPNFAAFLAAGPAPIFVGFGSTIIADATKITNMILEAAIRAKVRVVIQPSWSGLAQGGTFKIPSSVFILGDCPHDWLFPHMAAVVHHGGAGTTAAGLLAGKPTFIISINDDQPFWGWAVTQAGVGVQTCPMAQLTTPILTEAFKALLQPQLVERALAMKSLMEAEDGVENAVHSFYSHLPEPKPNSRRGRDRKRTQYP
ncbi:sterol 3-beta-glucosyltransferase [Thraustotheca clavata]|uniref:Sterol 3-beta-glucosyltransferase n=1 Tax=Thraustotheca clavata TaxID=74557 RepID=A0A1W0A9Z8_9STRA|nr:sterol 3-beta-glucosyltransferase [Thraustotheca clavata]